MGVNALHRGLSRDRRPERGTGVGRGARSDRDAHAERAERGMRADAGCRVALLCSAALCVAVACAGVMLGSTHVSFPDVVAFLFGGEVSSQATANIIGHVRLPRVAAALMSGAALAVAGCVIQTVLDNPLASPNVIGVNAGAGLSVLLTSALLPGALQAVPLAAFGGAMLTSLAVFAVSSHARASRMTIVLVGMAITQVFAAGMNAVLIVWPDAYVGASTFLVGGLAGVRMVDLGWPALCVAAGLALAVLGSRALNVMVAGDGVAQSVGMNVRAVRLGMLAVAALLAGASVSFAGMLGFVGLVVPHIVRHITGNDLVFLVPVSALVGAALVCLCDILARTLFSPYELPVGILMAFVGGPFFIWLIVRGRRSGRYA